MINTTAARILIESRMDTTDKMIELAQILAQDAKEYRHTKVDGKERKINKAGLLESLKYQINELTDLMLDVAKEEEAGK